MYETQGDEKRGSVVALAISSIEPASAVSGAMVCASTANDAPKAKQIAVRVLVRVSMVFLFSPRPIGADEVYSRRQRWISKSQPFARHVGWASAHRFHRQRGPCSAQQ